MGPYERPAGWGQGRLWVRTGVVQNFGTGKLGALAMPELFSPRQDHFSTLKGHVLLEQITESGERAELVELQEGPHKVFPRGLCHRLREQRCGAVLLDRST